MNQKEASSTFVFDKRVRGTIIDSRYNQKILKNARFLVSSLETLNEV